MEIGVATQSTFLPVVGEGWHKVPNCRCLQGTLSQSVHLDLEINHQAAEVADNDGRTWWLTTRNSQVYGTHVGKVELPISILNAVKNELENSPATSGY